MRLKTTKRYPFTLVELLTVIFIILLLAGMIIGGVGWANRKAAMVKTQSIITQLSLAIDQYRQEFGYYPVSLGVVYKISDVMVKGNDSGGVRYHGLEKRTAVGNPREYYIKNMEALSFSGGFLADSFGGFLYYRNPGVMNPQSYDLWSPGTDGRFGAGATTTATDAESPAAVNSDDITNWKRN